MGRGAASPFTWPCSQFRTAWVSCACRRKRRPIPTSRIFFRRPTACSARASICSHHRGRRGGRSQMAAPRCLAGGCLPAAQGLRPQPAATHDTDAIPSFASKARACTRSGRPDPRRHHRTGAFPLLHHRRARPQAGTAPGLHPQGHGKALRGHGYRDRRQVRRPRLRRLHSAYAWAYCMAVETATGSQAPERAVWLRALFLEIERIANHLGDLATSATTSPCPSASCSSGA